MGRCGLVGEVQEEAGICIHIAGSLRCTVESNTMLKSNYTTIKKNPTYIQTTNGVSLPNGQHFSLFNQK